MKKIVCIILLFCLSSLILCAQIDCDSIIFGPTNDKIYYSSQTVPYSGHVDCIGLYSIGIYRATFQYCVWLYFSGMWRHPDSTSKIRANGLLQNGKETGKWLYYNALTDSLIVEANFNDGKLEGVLRTIYNDSLSSFEYYHKNKLINAYKKFSHKFRKPLLTKKNKNISGHIDCKYNFQKETFLPNVRKALYLYQIWLSATGQDSDVTIIRCTGTLLHGLEEGKWLYYNTDNQLIIECEFLNGKLNGDYKLYDVGGMVHLVVFINDRNSKPRKVFYRKFK